MGTNWITLCVPSFDFYAPWKPMSNDSQLYGPRPVLGSPDYPYLFFCTSSSKLPLVVKILLESFNESFPDNKVDMVHFEINCEVAAPVRLAVYPRVTLYIGNF